MSKFIIDAVLIVASSDREVMNWGGMERISPQVTPRLDNVPRVLGDFNASGFGFFPLR